MLILTDEQQVAIQLKFFTQAGNVAAIGGPPAWNVSNPDILELVVDPDDPTSAKARTTGALGTCQVSATADADLGEGIREITGTLDVEVRAAEAMKVGIEAGQPELKE